jgi:hypothetical protein
MCIVICIDLFSSALFATRALGSHLFGLALQSRNVVRRSASRARRLCRLHLGRPSPYLRPRALNHAKGPLSQRCSRRDPRRYSAGRAVPELDWHNTRDDSPSGKPACASSCKPGHFCLATLVVQETERTLDSCLLPPKSSIRESMAIQVARPSRPRLTSGFELSDPGTNEQLRSARVE